MAYGVKYEMEFEDILGYGKKLQILKDGYSGSDEKIVGQKSPVVVKWKSQNDFYKPIIGSICTLNLFITDDVTYDEFYKFDEREYQVKIYYKDSSSAWQLYWIGFLVVDNYKEGFKSLPTAIKLNAYDNLGTLKNYDAPLDSSASYANRSRIADILANTGLSLDIWCQADIRWAVSSLPSPDSYPTEKAVMKNQLIRSEIYGHCDDLTKGYDVPNAKTQLETILKNYNCRIFQSYGKWFIVENSNVFDSNVKSSIWTTVSGGGTASGIRSSIKTQLVSASAETIQTDKYNSSGTATTSANESILRICPTTIKNIGGDLVREYIPPFAKAKYNFESKQINIYNYTDNVGFEYGSTGWTLSGYASIVTNDNVKQGNASLKLSDSAPTSGATEMFSNILANSQGWHYYMSASAIMSVFIELNNAESGGTPDVDVNFQIIAYKNPNTYYWDDENSTWTSTATTITRTFDVPNNWHDISIGINDTGIPTNLGSFSVGLKVFNCVYTSSYIDYIYFDNVGIRTSANKPEYSAAQQETRKLPSNYIEIAENNVSGDVFSDDYEMKGTYYFNGTPPSDFSFSRTRDYHTRRPMFTRNLQNIMNDHRDFVVRYEGTFRNEVEEPLSLHNRIWFNFGASVFQDDQSCYIDALEYDLRLATAKVVAHLPNDDDDISCNFRITSE